MDDFQGYTLEGMEELFSKPWSVRANVWFYLRCGCFLELVGRGKRNYHLLDVPEEHLLQAVREPDDGDDKVEEESAEGGVKGVAVTDCEHSEGREKDLNHEPDKQAVSPSASVSCS